MKKKMIFLLIGIIIVVVFFSLWNNEQMSYEKTIQLNVGEEIPRQMEYRVGKKNLKANIAWEQLEGDTVYIAGTYQGVFTVSKKRYKVSLIVVDNKKPTIEGVKDIIIYENDKIDLLKNITVKDNSHDEIKVEIKGDYDTTKKGEYSLTYIAQDASGNKIEQPFKLIVKEKKIEEPGVVGTTSKGYKIELKNGVYYIDGILIANKTYPLPRTYAPGGLLSELNQAFLELKAAAKKDGVELNIISGYRSYDSQDNIYRGYVNRDGKKEADRYSARPGYSEHQTGLAIDLNSLMFDFGTTKEGKWIRDNCYKYGFILRYPEGKEEITGYRPEAWHLRYIKDSTLAQTLYNGGNWLTLEEYFGITSQYEN